MAADTVTDRERFFGRLFNYANNWLTIAGIVLTTLSALMIIVFMLVELSGELENPYIGIFAYVVLPALFVLGLIEIPIGMWLRRRKLLRAGATDAQLEAYPRLDFNDPRLRRLATIVLVLTVVNAIILGSSSFLAVEKMETVEFCGETCHTVMQPEFTAYQNSPHSRVACVECHIGPGASWFVKSKLDGLRQVWHTALNTYHRPIETPLRTLRPARETCEQCHWPAKHHGDKLRVFARFGRDEANTPSYTVMLLKTGGGRLDLGTHGGIHWWHIESDNKIRYVSAEDDREEITWVELTTPDGEIVTYMRDGDSPPSDEQRAAARVMDCVDCHNRPTHLFESPTKALDGVLETHPDLRELPFYKRVALEAVETQYASHAEGVAAVRDAVLDYYRREQPEAAATKSLTIEKGADEAARIYSRSFFPEMETSWETHPNHIGHDDFPGCWRCHDGEMVSENEERVIPIDCENCHVVLLEDEPVLPDLANIQLDS